MLAPILLSSFLFMTPGSQAPDGVVIHRDSSPPPVPELNIRRRFGEKTILEVPSGQDRNPAAYRLDCGFRAWAEGADGVSTEPSPALAPALEAAKADMALLEALVGVRAETLASGNPDVRLLGRKIGHFLANLDSVRNPDLAHLEGLVLLREGENILGREPSALSPTIRASVNEALAKVAAVESKGAAVPAVAPRHRRPPRPDMASWPSVNLRAGVGRTEFAPGFLSNYTFQWRSFQIGVQGDKVIGEDEFPGGQVKITLWIPGEGERWLVYRVTVNLDARPEVGPPPMSEGWAPDPCYYYYHHERRFPNLYPPPESLALLSYDGDRCWGRDLPAPRFANAWINRKEGPWFMLYSFDLCNIPGNLPMMTPGVQESWFAEISYNGKTAQARFVWPAGSEATVASVYHGYALEQFWQTYPKLYDDERMRIECAGDDRFFREFAAPLLDGDKGLFEKFKSWNGHPPAIGKEPTKVQIAFYRALSRVTFIRERLDELRLRYLADIIDGRDPKPPEKAKRPEKADSALPQLDAEPLMDLDEEVF
jgi:hypothetical protein